jgi:hypothetical protein
MRAAQRKTSQSSPCHPPAGGTKLPPSLRQMLPTPAASTGLTRPAAMVLGEEAADHRQPQGPHAVDDVREVLQGVAPPVDAHHPVVVPPHPPQDGLCRGGATVLSVCPCLPLPVQLCPCPCCRYVGGMLCQAVRQPACPARVPALMPVRPKER